MFEPSFGICECINDYNFYPLVNGTKAKEPSSSYRKGHVYKFEYKDAIYYLYCLNTGERKLCDSLFFERIFSVVEETVFYSKEMIKNLGYESVEDFVADYVNNYTNCCVRYMPNGVYLDYDFDSSAYYSTNHTSISTNTYDKNFKIKFNT